MHRKAVFALAAIFLAIALLVPPIMFFIAIESNLPFIFTPNNNPGLQTSGNVTIINVTRANEISQSLTNTAYITIVVVAIFIPLFVVALYYGVNHPHPHGKIEEIEP